MEIRPIEAPRWADLSLIEKVRTIAALIGGIQVIGTLFFAIAVPIPDEYWHIAAPLVPAMFVLGIAIFHFCKPRWYIELRK